MMRHAVGIGIAFCNFVVARVGAYACGSKSASLACIGMHWLVEPISDCATQQAWSSRLGGAVA